MERLSPNDQHKLQNILQYYNEYRKTHYVDTIAIEIENKKRQEEQAEIDRQLENIENIKKTRQYILLNDQKNDMNKQIVIYENTIYELRNEYEECKKWEDILNDTEEVTNICDKINVLYDTIETIEHKQLDLIRENGIDTELLENKNIKIQL